MSTLLFCFVTGAQTGKNVFLPIAIKAESSELAFHLDPLEGLKALLFTWSSGKGIFFLSEVDSNVLQRLAIY